MSAGVSRDGERRAAERFYRSGRLSQAEKTCRAVLGDSPGDAATRHLLGVICAQTGRIDEAVAELSRASADAPRDTRILVVLGAVLCESGRPDQAEGRYRKALAIEPGLADAHKDLGAALLEMGRTDDAVAALTEALALAPDHPDAHYNMGNALRARGEDTAAAAHYRRALVLAPAHRDAHTNLGLALIEIGEAEDALRHLRRAVELAPDDPDAQANLGAAVADFGHPEEAERIYRAMLARTPDDRGLLRALGGLYRKMRRFTEAEGAYRRAVALDAGDVEARVGMAYAREGGGDLAGAIEIGRAILADGAKLTVVHVLLANLLGALGRADQAEAHYRQAIDAEPGGGGIRPLTGALAHVGGDAELARLRAMLDEPARRQTDIGEIHLAIANILDRRGMADHAFPHFAAGNAIKSRRSGYRPEAHARLTERIASIFDAALFDDLKGVAPRAITGARPVFVIGMPRSGTTLVEQILASHSGVHGAGELDGLERAAAMAGQRAGVTDDFPDSARALSPAIASEAAAYYLDAMRRSGAADGVVAIDKMPTNFHLLGFAALLFPDALVIHCRRDPLDTCLSCFVTNFTEETGFARDLAHLGAYYRDYQRLMAHWRAVLPLPMLEVDYEALVADQENQSRRMVRFLGLEWQAACLDFYRTQRPVMTASADQVRRPIYASSIGRARAYEPHIGALIEALGDGCDSD